MGIKPSSISTLAGSYLPGEVLHRVPFTNTIAASGNASLLTVPVPATPNSVASVWMSWIEIGENSTPAVVSQFGWLVRAADDTVVSSVSTLTPPGSVDLSVDISDDDVTFGVINNYLVPLYITGTLVVTEFTTSTVAIPGGK